MSLTQGGTLKHYFLITLALLISACGPSDTLELRKLSIVDADGVERIRFSVTDDKVANIAFYGSDGKPRGGMGSGDKQFALAATAGNGGGILLVDNADGSTVTLLDRNGNTRAEMSTWTEGAEVSVQNSAGDEKASLKSVDSIATGLIVKNDKETGSILIKGVGRAFLTDIH